MTPAALRGFAWATSSLLLSSSVDGAPFVAANLGKRLHEAPVLGRSGRGATGLLRIGGLELAARPCRHGGVAGKLLGRRFMPASRPIREAEASMVAREAGVATPEIVAIYFERPGRRMPVVLTRLVRGEPLVRFVREDGARKILRPLAASIHSLFHAGVHHPDLSLGNFLVEQGEDLRLQVLDFDRARIRRPLPLSIKRQMLARMSRSYRKLVHLGRLPQRDLPPLRFLAALCQLDPALRPILRSLPASFPLHGLFWR